MRRSADAWHSSIASANTRSFLGLVLAWSVGTQALVDLGGPVGDLGEAHDGHGVVLAHRPAVYLLEEVEHLVEPAKLRVVVLDVPGGEFARALDVDAVYHRVEDLLPRGVLK